MKIRTKGGVKWSYRPWGRKTLQKLGRKWQEIFCAALPSQRERERKVWKSFEKVIESVKALFFLKLETRCSIDQKTGSINRTRQRLTEFFKQDFDWSKIRLQLIENQIGSIENLEKQLFREKTRFLKAYLKALNIRHKNSWVWDEMLFQNTSFKPNFSKN